MTLLNKLDVLCQKSTSLDEYPFATGVSHNVLFYQADSLRQQDPQSVQKIQSELSHALLKGPGVYVIKQAFKPRVIDRFNELLFSLIESEHAEGIGQGDHFAQSGHISGACVVYCYGIQNFLVCNTQFCMYHFCPNRGV